MEAMKCLTVAVDCDLLQQTKEEALAKLEE